MSRDVEAYRQAIECDGFAVTPPLVDEDTRTRLLEALSRVDQDASRRRGRAYALRNILARVPAVREFAASPAIRELVEPVLGGEARAIRAILFDKVPEANWHVGWHQDLIIPVRKKHDVPGFGSWSVKRGVPHVKPPSYVLERMLTLRLHLDDCGEQNGPLRVMPGSHRKGELTGEAVKHIAASQQPFPCNAPAGSILMMRPLLLHASSPASSPRHRRILHLELAGCDLPGGLEWPE